MGPFIPKKDSVNEEGGRNRRRMPRVANFSFDTSNWNLVVADPVEPPRLRVHQGRWQSPGYHYIYCEDCDFVTNHYPEPSDVAAYFEWHEHENTADRIEIN